MRLVHQNLVAALALALAALAPACSEDPPAGVDAGLADAAPVRTPDAGGAAAAAPDAGEADAREADASPPDADLGQDAAPGCPSWKVELNTFSAAGATASARIEDGTLVLASQGDTGHTCSSELSPCDSIKVYQRELQGDFDVVAEVDGLDGAGAFAGLSLFVTSGAFNNFAATSIFGGDGSLPNLSVERRGGGSNEQRATGVSTTHATLRVRRSNGVVTISGAAGEETLEQTGISMGGALVVGIGLDEGSSANVTGRVASFTVTGGGSVVQSDAFDCDATLH